MTDENKRERISLSLAAFKTQPLFDASISLFDTLGYDTRLRQPLDEGTYSEFKRLFVDSSLSVQLGKESFSEEKARTAEWGRIELLFQLTEDSLRLKRTGDSDGSGAGSRASDGDGDGDGKVDAQIIKSYLFFAIDLSGEEYSRSALAAITREVNKVFPMPVMIVFRYGEGDGRRITIAANNRRVDKRDKDRDVLLKVSLIKDIRLLRPHRSHIDILFDLCFDTLQSTYRFTDFVGLHNSWISALDTRVLNKRFYAELAAWFFWACGKVRFPNFLDSRGRKHSTGARDCVPCPQEGAIASVPCAKASETRRKAVTGIASQATQESKIAMTGNARDDEEHNMEGVIRFISRFLFVWFIKEKGLVSERLFSEDWARRALRDFAPQGSGTVYYKAVLQNLFFVALNCPIENRAFRKMGTRYSKDMGIDHLMRYRSLFINKEGADEFLSIVNGTTPFMNGGLFECLDVLESRPDGTPCKIYVEGFSDRKDNTLVFPDELLFGEERTADLSAFYEGDNKHKADKVRGLIPLLRQYKFTVSENTPLEEDVALDPELLGRVFENLLASVNSETKTSARKETGSFYTPREIVGYMISEALQAVLASDGSGCAAVTVDGDSDGRDYAAMPPLTALFSDAAEAPSLPIEARRALVRRISSLKILDPACGSGAFPMGALQALVALLNKLDPDNTLWQEAQLERAKAALDPVHDKEGWEKAKASIDEIFNMSREDADYARKLYLIENCIYGVDIQAIAVQITKLRCFITLAIDQRRDVTKSNFGIRPLPNLETRFIAANTLVKLKGEAGELVSGRVFDLQKEIAANRHKLFNTTATARKNELRAKDRALRAELRDELADMGMLSKADAARIAAWDPFNKEAASDWFDSEWMFGTKEFDIVVGNPPYVIVKGDDKMKDYYTNNYKVAHGGKRNLYHLFFERGISMLRKGGALSLITPDTYLAGNDTKELRKFLVQNCRIENIITYTEKDKVFENVTQAVAVSVMVKGARFSDFCLTRGKEKRTIQAKDITEEQYYVFRWSDSVIERMNKTKTTFADFCTGYQGDVNLTVKKAYFTKTKRKGDYPLVRGIQIAPYYWSGSDEYCSAAALSRQHQNMERIVFQQISNVGQQRRIKATLIKDVILGNSVNYIYPKANSVSLLYLLAVLNSKPVNYYFKFYSQTNHVTMAELYSIPCPPASPAEQARLASWAEKILKAKAQDAAADTSALEGKIGKAVEALYALTEEEKAALRSKSATQLQQ